MVHRMISTKERNTLPKATVSPDFHRTPPHIKMRFETSTIHAIGDKVCFSAISFLEIVLHALAQNDDLVRIFHGIFFALTDKFGTKP